MNWFQSFGLRFKMLFSVVLSCLICAIAAVSVAVYYNKIEFQHGLVEKSRTIHSRLNSATRYVAQQGGLRSTIDHYTNKYKSSDELTEEDKLQILKQVPIYAAMAIGADDAEKENYKFRVFSNEARNKNNVATAEEMVIFNKFEANPALEELISNDGQVVTVYRAVRLKEAHGCFVCHGSPSTSPWGNGKDILGYKMEDWKDGKLHGVFAISNNIIKAEKAQTASGKTSATGYLVLFIGLSAIIALILATWIISGPLSSLKRVAKNLTEAGEQFASASNQIAGSSQVLSQSTSQQASSLEETVATMEEITSMVRLSSENGKQAAALASSTQEVAIKGEAEIKILIDSIHSISADSKKIAEITDVIDDMAFQTNLLALNAAVEAARAGEQGKGFAVVAEAVRNLAQKSASAAKDITVLIKKSVEKIETGAKQASQGGAVLTEIVNAVKKVADLNREIASASEEQSNGIVQIGKALNQMDQVTQENAASSEEAASSAEELAAQSSSLKTTVVSLKGVVLGTK